MDDSDHHYLDDISVCLNSSTIGNEEAIEVAQLVASRVDIRQYQYQIELKLLQDVLPILASFLLKLPYDVEIPSDTLQKEKGYFNPTLVT